MTIRQWQIALVAAALAASSLDAASSIVRLDGSPLRATEIDALIQHAMRVGRVTGLGVAILNNRKVEYLKTFGYRDAAARRPLTVNSVMTGASFTKSAFAYAVMQLVESKLLDLDAPVQHYLSKPLPQYPGYEALADDARYERITIRMLLSHTAGFHNLRVQNGGRVTINFEPGSRYAYSGEGMRLLQLVVEEVTRAPIETLMRQRVFGPAGMHRTSMTWQSAFESDFATPHDRDGNARRLVKRQKADVAGSMQTTLADVAHFAERVMRGGGLRPATRDLMFSPQIAILSRRQFPTLSTDTTEANRSIRLSYGLGWGLYFTPRGKAVFKEGHDDGWQHYLVLFDDAGIGLVMMSNSDNAEGIFPRLIEDLLRNPYTPIEWEGYAPVL